MRPDTFGASGMCRVVSTDRKQVSGSSMSFGAVVLFSFTHIAYKNPYGRMMTRWSKGGLVFFERQTGSSNCFPPPK